MQRTILSIGQAIVSAAANGARLWPKRRLRNYSGSVIVFRKVSPMIFAFRTFRMRPQPRLRYPAHKAAALDPIEALRYE